MLGLLIGAAAGGGYAFLGSATENQKKIVDQVRAGNAHARSGEYAQAAKAYELALQLDPENAYALRNLGATLALAKQPDQAAEAYRNYLRSSRNKPEAEAVRRVLTEAGLGESEPGGRRP